MDFDYSNACRKIIEHYSHYLSEKERIILYKFIEINNYDEEKIIYINKLIDRIWQLTLTSVKSMKNGTPFTFLITKDIVPNKIINDDLNKLKEESHRIELIDEKNILDFYPGDSGIIIEINYFNTSSEPILPIDFEEQKAIKVKAQLEIKGIYNISLGLDNYEYEQKSTKEFANSQNVLFLEIIKPTFNNNRLTNKDKEYLVETIISYFLIQNNYNEFRKWRDYLTLKYKKVIIDKYNEFLNNIIDLETMINQIWTILYNDEHLLTNGSIYDKINGVNGGYIL